MKLRLLFLLIPVILGTSVNGQDCASYSSLQKGTKYEMTTYNAKDKEQGKNQVEVKNVTASGGKKTFDLHITTLDEKGAEVHNGNFQIICDGEKIMIDMSQMLKEAGAAMENQDMELAMEGTFVEIPADLSVGQSLSDAVISMKVVNKTTKEPFMDINMKLVNRKVLSKESATTKAGTFEVFKISYDMEGTMKMMGQQVPIGKGTKTVEYFSREVGTVKTETYQNDKLQSYTVLTSLSKG